MGPRSWPRQRGAWCAPAWPKCGGSCVPARALARRQRRRALPSASSRPRVSVRCNIRHFVAFPTWPRQHGACSGKCSQKICELKGTNAPRARRLRRKAAERGCAGRRHGRLVLGGFPAQAARARRVGTVEFADLLGTFSAARAMLARPGWREPTGPTTETARPRVAA